MGESSRQDNSAHGESKIADINKKSEYVPFSEHLIVDDRDNSFEKVRERSRDNKYKEVTKDEKEEREKMKKKMLGL